MKNVQTPLSDMLDSITAGRLGRAGIFTVQDYLDRLVTGADGVLCIHKFGSHQFQYVNNTIMQQCKRSQFLPRPDAASELAGACFLIGRMILNPKDPYAIGLKLPVFLIYFPGFCRDIVAYPDEIFEAGEEQ